MWSIDQFVFIATMLVVQVANFYGVRVNLLDVAKPYDASGLSRLWPRAQGENWWQYKPDKEDKDFIRSLYRREGICQPIAHAVWAYMQL